MVGSTNIRNVSSVIESAPYEFRLWKHAVPPTGVGLNDLLSLSVSTQAAGRQDMTRKDHLPRIGVALNELLAGRPLVH